jgi:HK97 family phage portal protein
MIFDRIFKKASPVVVTKQPEQQLVKKNLNYSGLSFYDYLYSEQSTYDLSVIHTLLLYSHVSPFYMAVDKIARAISEIPFKVRDKKTGEFIDHELLELLANPNAGQSECSFKYELSSFFSITGNAFLNTTGRPERAPLEIWNIQPQRVTPIYAQEYNMGQLPSRYQVTSILESAKFFNAKEVQMGASSVMRYYSEINGELLHIRQLNPFYNANNFFGMSKARPLMTELEQYQHGNINNLSLLKRGARPSLALVNTSGVELTEDQYQRLVDQMTLYSGSQNAGTIPILDGVDAKEVSQSNKDMQFKELHDSTKAAIYNIYGIPLAMTSDSAMTFNNLETSQLQFYDNAVIPQLRTLTVELTRLLMYRYKNSENLEITCSPNDIEALKPRALDNATKLNALNVSTMNEVRSMIGEKPLDSGGNVIYGPTTNMPIAGEKSELETAQEQQAPAPAPDAAEATEDNKKQFILEMKKTTDYSDEKINQLWESVKCL